LNWRFWDRKKPARSILAANYRRNIPPKPKELPYRIGRYLVVHLSKDPDWVWSLKCVMQVKDNQKEIWDFRIFNPLQVKEKGVVVNSCATLDDYPELILYQGWYDKSSWNFEIKPQ